MAHGLFFLPEDVECTFCGKTPCPCDEPDDPEPTPRIEVICHRTRDDKWWDVWMDGELKHEHCDRVDLEKLGLERYPVAQTYCH